MSSVRLGCLNLTHAAAVIGNLEPWSESLDNPIFDAQNRPPLPPYPLNRAVSFDATRRIIAAASSLRHDLDYLA